MFDEKLIITMHSCKGFVLTLRAENSVAKIRNKKTAQNWLRNDVGRKITKIRPKPWCSEQKLLMMSKDKTNQIVDVSHDLSESKFSLAKEFLIFFSTNQRA